MTKPDSRLEVNYPLAIGNTWTYAGTEPRGASGRDSIMATVLMNDTQYYIFDGGQALVHIGLGRPKVTLNAKQQLVIGYHPDYEPLVYFDFGAPLGTTWSYEPPIDFEHSVWDIELESVSDTITVPAGHFSNCYRFGFTNIGGWPKYAQFWIAPGVGLIKYCATNKVGFELTTYSIAE